MTGAAPVVAASIKKLGDLTSKAKYALGELEDSRDFASTHDVACAAIEAINTELATLREAAKADR